MRSSIKIDSFAYYFWICIYFLVILLFYIPSILPGFSLVIFPISS